ncbi:hypothetical protein D3C81_2342940 [compost metagenome]
MARARARREIHLTVCNQLAVHNPVDQHLINPEITYQHPFPGAVRNNRMRVGGILPVLADS